MRRPVWRDIVNDLTSKSQTIAAALVNEPCNNELLNQIGNSEQIMDILYNFLCRSEAENKPFDQKMVEVIANHIANNGYQPNSDSIIPTNDFICPMEVITSDPGYIEIDGKYYCFGYIAQSTYQNEVIAGWLSSLINIDAGVDVNVWCEKKSTAMAKEGIARSLQLSAAERSNRAIGATDIADLDERNKSSDYLLRGLSHGHDLLDFSIMLTVIADTPTQLREKFKQIQDYVLRLGPTLNPTYFNQDLAFLTALPLCNPNRSVLRYAKRNILSGDFAAFYPFASFEINDPHGVKIGMNCINNSPVFLDLFNRTLYMNGHGVIFGSSGSGKTYLLQCLALRYRQLNTKVIIVAPYKGHEYMRACNEIGGTYINLAPGSPQTINIMEIRKRDNSVNSRVFGMGEQTSILVEKIQQIHTFFSLIKPDMTHWERTILDEALLRLYQRFGITTDNNSLTDPDNPGKYRKMPVLGDLYEDLKQVKKGAEGLLDCLSRFVSGSAQAFNHQTNVNLDNRYVVIDVSRMPNELMPIAIFVATDFVNDNIQANVYEQDAVFLDEISRLIGLNGSSEAALFVLRLYKEVRAYNAIVISATQDTNDFMALENGLYGEGILANARMKVIMKPEEREIERLTEKLGLSKSEEKQLEHLQRGEALLLVNRNHTKIRATASFEEHCLITTDPEELKAIYGTGC